MAIYLISDIHLDPKNTDTYGRFRQYLESIKSDAVQLYILGDLFEYWIGDDGLDLLGHRPAVEALKDLSESGVRIFIMHGNRDFLIGNSFIDHFNGTLIPDPYIITVNDEAILLMHGDSLCTDDVGHQRYREIVLDPEWQREVLKLSVHERHDRARDMRMQSETGKIEKNEELMDVNLDAVAQTMHRHDVRILIHGHVHRTAVHKLTVNGRAAYRYVLGDWDSGNDGVIRISPNGEINLYAPFC
ncbi:MAG: UDP-2,3-diacylglucosamine diphosphatase [Acidiferrobacterales bacterium]|nr:UDP-2,3-diacylglucosamine diphosphatase [Acidiferrobacterales bacterium]